MSFSTILVANRGEIACRVMRTARSLGFRTVAVYSEADRDAVHVRTADVATCIGPAPVRESYLDVAAILAAAARTGADAIHPGYGFLSENADFARACRDAGLVFIGPSPEAIHAMGNKAQAKRLAIEAGVPTIPGWQGDDQSDENLAARAREVGFPVLVKAAAGGGGRGMRLVRTEDELLPSIRTARAEAASAFGSGELLLERALLEARHVEIQVFGDSKGNVIHLGERDCSIQRRHQKIVEESPSPVVDDALRARMGEAGANAARKIGYVGAGTVEFLLDADGSFYFLEMNTRLQVEHPVTELVTGVDLVEWQLRIAAGDALPLTQDQVRLRGHAIEVRLYAEDPYDGFLPQTGRIARFRPGTSGTDSARAVDGRRIDHGVVEGQEISPWYDPMLAKVIASGRDREDARRRLVHLLGETVLLGSTTNKTFLQQVLAHPVFVAGGATTKFIDAHLVAAGTTAPLPPKTTDVTRAVAAILRAPRAGAFVAPTTGKGGYPLRLAERGAQFDALVRYDGAGVDVVLGATSVHLDALTVEGDVLTYEHEGVRRRVAFVVEGDRVHLDDTVATYTFLELPTYTLRKEAAGDGRVLAPMNGRIVSVHAEVGARVSRGALLVVLEAMKMQHQVLADVEGTVVEVNVAANDQVATKKLLVRIEP